MSVFETLSQWGWVSIAWAEVLAAYVGYLLYLRWRAKRARDEDES